MKITSIDFKTAALSALSALLILSFTACGKKSSPADNSAVNSNSTSTPEWKTVKDVNGVIHYGSFMYDELNRDVSFTAPYFDFDQPSANGTPSERVLYWSGTVNSNNSLQFNQMIYGFEITGSCLDVDCNTANIKVDKTSGKFHGITEYFYTRKTDQSFEVRRETYFPTELSDTNSSYRAQAFTSMANTSKVAVELIFHIPTSSTTYPRRVSISGPIGKNVRYNTLTKAYDSNGRPAASGYAGEGPALEISSVPADDEVIRFNLGTDSSLVMWLQH